VPVVELSSDDEESQPVETPVISMSLGKTRPNNAKNYKNYRKEIMQYCLINGRGATLKHYHYMGIVLPSTYCIYHSRVAGEDVRPLDQGVQD